MINALFKFIWSIIVCLVTICVVLPVCVIGIAFVIAMIPVCIVLLPFILLGAELVKHINFKDEEEE